MVTSLSLLGLGAVALVIGAEANAAHDPRDITWDGVTYTITQHEAGEDLVTEIGRDGLVVADLHQSTDLLCDRSPPVRLDVDRDGVDDLLVDDCGHWVYETWRAGALEQIRASGDELPGLRTAWAGEVDRAGATAAALGLLLVIAGGISFLLRSNAGENAGEDGPAPG